MISENYSKIRNIYDLSSSPWNSNGEELDLHQRKSKISINERNKSWISFLQYSRSSEVIQIGLALVGIPFSEKSLLQGRLTMCFFLSQKALGKEEQASFSSLALKSLIFYCVLGSSIYFLCLSNLRSSFRKDN